MKAKYTAKDLKPMKLYPDAKEALLKYQHKHGLKNPSLAVLRLTDKVAKIEVDN